MSEFSPWSEIQSDYLKWIPERRAGLEESLSFGVSFLDEALGGIFQKEDLIVLAGKSGQGKSELALHIGLHNALKGKRVFHFALEAESREISKRMAFKLLVQRHYANVLRENEKPSFLEWSMGRQENLLGPYEDFVVAELGKLKNFKTFYRDESFTVQDFNRAVIGIKDEADLICLDHLHYVDLEDANENRALSEVIKSFRQIALKYAKPVILVCHIRKSDRRFSDICPSMEDIHGSSDIYKNATKVITIAPARSQDLELEAMGSHRWPTFMRIAKCRKEGARAKYTGVCVFDSRLNTYESQYILGGISFDGQKFEPTERAELPEWARSAKRQAPEASVQVHERSLRSHHGYVQGRD